MCHFCTESVGTTNYWAHALWAFKLQTVSVLKYWSGSNIPQSAYFVHIIDNAPLFVSCLYQRPFFRITIFLHQAPFWGSMLAISVFGQKFWKDKTTLKLQSTYKKNVTITPHMLLTWILILYNDSVWKTVFKFLCSLYLRLKLFRSQIEPLATFWRNFFFLVSGALFTVVVKAIGLFSVYQNYVKSLFFSNELTFCEHQLPHQFLMLVFFYVQVPSFLDGDSEFAGSAAWYQV